MVWGDSEGGWSDYPMAKRAVEVSSSGPSAQAQDDKSANIVCDSPSAADVETSVASEKTNSGGDTEILHIDEEKGKDVYDQVNLEEKTDELDQSQAGSDLGRTPESRPPPEQVVMDEDQAPDPGESRGALAGPNPEPMHDEFMVDLYPNNLEDAYAIGDQFINDKSNEVEPEKPNVEAEVVSMVTVPIFQASSSVPPLSTSVPVIDLSPPKPASSTTQAPIFKATTTTTTTTLPTPPQQKSTTESELAARVTSLEKKLSELEQKNKTLDNTSQNLRSRVFTLELRDLPHKIDEAVCKSVKESQALESSAWKKSDTRDAPPSFSKQQYDPHAEQPVDDIPMPDTANISDSEDTDSAYLPNIKQRPEWLKPIPDDERPATPEPAGSAPMTSVPLTVYLIGGFIVRNSTLTDTLLNQAARKGFQKFVSSDFEDLNMLLLQGHLNHLSGSDKRMLSTAVNMWTRNLVIRQWVEDFQLSIESYQKQLNLTKPGWDAKGFEYKHDYTIIESPRTVVFPVGNNE
nr:hypothetical protein [Tanacetum cinerariifolium]